MACTAIVREWHGDEGWGVLDSAETPGGCWVHFSAIRSHGYRALFRGQRVQLDWAAAHQDGYLFRAVSVVP